MGALLFIQLSILFVKLQPTFVRLLYKIMRLFSEFIAAILAPVQIQFSINNFERLGVYSGNLAGYC
jgi:hypothetical protein